MSPRLPSFARQGVLHLLMGPWFETVADLISGADALRHRSYGVIECREGRLSQVRLRPFPKIASVPGIFLFGNWFHRLWPGDRFWLYYNQPLRFPRFLVLRYVVSTRATTFATCLRSLEVLDEVARLKRSDAILCDVANWRISDRLMARWGWEPHCPSSWHRHFIKRFYGEYTAKAGVATAAREPIGV